MLRELCGSLFMVGLLVFVFSWAVVIKPSPTIPMTEKDVREVYNNLIKYTGGGVNIAPKLVIVKDDLTWNMFTDGEAVYVTTGFIKASVNQSELAVGLAHELGHVFLDSVTVLPMRNSVLSEANADKWGWYLMVRAGYDVCAAKDVWAKRMVKNGDHLFPSDHPSYTYRVWQFDFPMCRG